nr:zinc finger A20 and AN1 domain-containing stress-associated protein 8-like [Ipomoea batatas]
MIGSENFGKGFCLIPLANRLDFRALAAELLYKGKFAVMEQNDASCQAPQAPILCVNNCGFFGTEATMNMCSKCYKDTVLKQEQAKLAATSIENIVNGGSSSSGKAVHFVVGAEEDSAVSTVVPTQISCAPPVSENGELAKEGPKRCNTCRKRVGLTGFNCRCGHLFCAVHRYSDKHDCPFDYHKAAQDAITKANPVVRAEKLDKI